MGQRDFGFLLVPVLALLAFLLPGVAITARPAGTSPEASGEPEAISDERPPLSNSAASLIADSYGTLASRSQLTAQECLIPTLPDPVDAANLSYTYDRYIDAIQRAMEAAGYVLDRFDLPWLDNETNRPGSQTGAGLAACSWCCSPSRRTRSSRTSCC